MPAKGLDASFARQTGSPYANQPQEILVMDNIVSTPSPKVTTGPLPSSQKVYVTPDQAPDLSGPLHEIALSAPAGPRVRASHTTGPYTDSSGVLDVSKALARTRRRCVLQRRAA